MWLIDYIVTKNEYNGTSVIRAEDNRIEIHYEQQVVQVFPKGQNPVKEQWIYPMSAVIVIHGNDVDE